MAGHTIELHRIIRCPAERVYRAFLDPQALAKWLPPHGFTCAVHELNAVEGGRFHMSFTNFSTAQSHSFGGSYLELKPHELIRYTDVFDDPSMAGTMLTSIKLRQVSCGTEVHIEQAGIPLQIPAESCYLGWQESLALLAWLVEAEIPAS